MRIETNPQKRVSNAETTSQCTFQFKTECKGLRPKVSPFRRWDSLEGQETPSVDHFQQRNRQSDQPPLPLDSAEARHIPPIKTRLHQLIRMCNGRCTSRNSLSRKGTLPPLPRQQATCLHEGSSVEMELRRACALSPHGTRAGPAPGENKGTRRRPHRPLPGENHLYSHGFYHPGLSEVNMGVEALTVVTSYSGILTSKNFYCKAVGKVI